MCVCACVRVCHLSLCVLGVCILSPYIHAYVWAFLSVCVRCVSVCDICLCIISLCVISLGVSSLDTRYPCVNSLSVLSLSR